MNITLRHFKFSMFNVKLTLCHFEFTLIHIKNDFASFLIQFDCRINKIAPHSIYSYTPEFVFAI